MADFLANSIIAPTEQGPCSIELEFVCDGKLGNYNERYLFVSPPSGPSQATLWSFVLIAGESMSAGSPFDDLGSSSQPLGDPLAGADPLAAAPAGDVPFEAVGEDSPLATALVPSEPEASVQGKPPRFNVYTAMLGLSFFALTIASLLLLMELGNYGGSFGTWWKTGTTAAN